MGIKSIECGAIHRRDIERGDSHLQLTVHTDTALQSCKYLRIMKYNPITGKTYT